MKGRMSNVVLGAAVAVGAALILWVGIREGRRSAGVAPGAEAPEFVMQRYGGGKLALSELRGQVVMLNFWATWCSPCIEELPYMVKLAREYEEKGFAFVAASRDDAPADVGIFLDRRVPQAQPYVTYAPDIVGSVYGVQVLPTTFFIDREGRIIESHLGKLSERDLRKRIEHALSQ